MGHVRFPSLFCCNGSLEVVFLFLALCPVSAGPLLFLELHGHDVRIPGVCF